MVLVQTFKILIAIILVSLVAGCSSNPPVPVIDRSPTDEHPNNRKPAEVQVQQKPANKTNDWRPNTYTVKPKDTLYSISLKFSLDYKEIAALNGIPAPYHIRVGQVLSIPRVTYAPTTQEESTATTVPLGGNDQPIIAESTKTEVTGVPTISAPKAFREPYSKSAAERVEPIIVVENSINEPSEAETVTRVTKPEIQTKPKPAPVITAEQITWAWPHDGKIIAAFNNTNKGLDLAGKVGQPVKAAAAGKVIYSGSDLRGYGRMVIIKHNALYLSVYAHNSHIFAKEGQLVSLGQKIAELGSSSSNRPKLHFEIRRQGKSIDPVPYLPKR